MCSFFADTSIIRRAKKFKFKDDVQKNIVIALICIVKHIYAQFLGKYDLT